MPEWLTNGFFIQQELFRLFLSLLSSLFIAFLVQSVLVRRDRRIKLLEQQQSQLNDLRAEFVQIFNDYYTLRKRYTSIHDTIHGKMMRNRYIKNNQGRINEILDGLILQGIQLEARYASLIEQFKVQFPDLWNKIQPIMDYQKPDERSSLGSYFSFLRHLIEQDIDIDDKLKNILSQHFREALEIINTYERRLLKLLGQHMITESDEPHYSNLGYAIGNDSSSNEKEQEQDKELLYRLLKNV